MAREFDFEMGPSDAAIRTSQAEPPMTAKLSAEALERLEALAKAATPGPWNHYHAAAPKRTTAQDTNAIMKDGRQVVAWSGFDGADSTEKRRKADAAYIAAANPSVLLRLTAQVREAEARWRAFIKAHGELMPTGKLDQLGRVSYDMWGDVRDIIKRLDPDAYRLPPPPAQREGRE